MSRLIRFGSPFLVLLVLLTGCARSPEARKARHLDRGDRYFKQEKYREAILEYSNTLRIEGTNAHATRQLGFAHYELGELGQAFRYLLRAEELDPADVDVRLKLGHVYLVGGRPDDAEAQAEVVLRSRPRNLDALVLVAAAARTPDEVAAVVRRLEAVSGELGHAAKFHLALAGLHLRMRDAARAERALREAVAREPRSVEAHVALGNFHAAGRDAAQAEAAYKVAAGLAPVASPARVRLAGYYVQLGRREEAKRILQEITKQAPDHLPAWRLLGSIALAEDRLDDGLKAASVVLKRSPADVEARILRGRVHLAKGETTQAITEFQQILKAEPRLAPVQYQLAVAHLRAGNVQQAKAELREATTNAPNYVEAALLLAELNLKSGAVPVAIQDLERLIARQPGATGAYALLSAAYLSRRDAPRAVAAARRLAQAAPRDPRGPYLVGVALLAEGKRAEARRELETALKVAPGFLDPIVQLVRLDLAETQPQAALDRARRQAALVPGSGGHQALLGNLHLARGEAGPAEKAFLQAIELSPRLLDPYVRLGTLYADSGRYDQALAKLAEAARVGPQNPAPLMMTGVVHEQRGDVPRAREAYEKALALSPRFVPAANNLAWLYTEHGGDKDRALSLAQMARDLSPDDPRISDTLGWVLYRRGAYQRALNLLRESARKLPDNPQVQYHLGMTYAQLGDRENARKALVFAVRSPESFHGKDEAKETLARIMRKQVPPLTPALSLSEGEGALLETLAPSGGEGRVRGSTGGRRRLRE